jgi:hypothetical protein
MSIAEDLGKLIIMMNPYAGGFGASHIPRGNPAVCAADYDSEPYP